MSEVEATVELIQWIDEGIDCLVVKHEFFSVWCGYVGVPEGHPDYARAGFDDRCGYGLSCNDIYDVHGGITYASNSNDRITHIFMPEHDVRSAFHDRGKICHHLGSIANKQVWWIGFDCAHGGDVLPRYPSVSTLDATYKDIGFVQAECRSLARQVQARWSAVAATLTA